ncbi:DUF3440 domain-containing protein [Lactococcus sp. DD01]|uniref:DUF3440 domain-containing protein n=1 Tax=Lactococcus sp. DD01 TaxID=1776443 RepID=UPI0012E79247
MFLILNQFIIGYLRLFGLQFQSSIWIKISCRIYFLMGPVKFMRIANPFRYCGIQSLKLYYEIEPETWGTEKLRGVYVAKLCMLPFAGFSA